MSELERFVRRTSIAYFSMEIALRPEMHTYAGGLGMLAGDMARSCADLDLPMIFVTLASRAGYLQQQIDGEGHQIEQPDPWDLGSWAEPLATMVWVEIAGRPVWIRPWLYVLKRPLGHTAPVLLLDTDLDQN